MFTGIIEEVGTLLATRKASKSESLTIEAPNVLQDAKVGDSIAVNGICLTATSISGNTFTADVMAETMRRTSLGTLHTGSKVNLERAMATGWIYDGTAWYYMESDGSMAVNRWIGNDYVGWDGKWS